MTTNCLGRYTLQAMRTTRDGNGKGDRYPLIYPWLWGPGTHKALVRMDDALGGLDRQHLLVLLRDSPFELQGQP